MKKLLFTLLTVLLATPLAGMENQPNPVTTVANPEDRDVDEKVWDIPNDVFCYEILPFLTLKEMLPLMLTHTDFCKLVNLFLTEENATILEVEVAASYTRDPSRGKRNVWSLIEKFQTFKHPLVIIINDPCQHTYPGFLKRLLEAIPTIERQGTNLQLKELIILGNAHLKKRILESGKKSTWCKNHPYQETHELNLAQIASLKEADILKTERPPLPNRTVHQPMTTTPQNFPVQNNQQRTTPQPLPRYQPTQDENPCLAMPQYIPFPGGQRLRYRAAQLTDLPLDIIRWVILPFLDKQTLFATFLVNREFYHAAQLEWRGRRSWILCRRFLWNFLESNTHPEMTPVELLQALANTLREWHLTNEERNMLHNHVQRRHAREELERRIRRFFTSAIRNAGAYHLVDSADDVANRIIDHLMQENNLIL